MLFIVYMCNYYERKNIMKRFYTIILLTLMILCVFCSCEKSESDNKLTGNITDNNEEELTENITTNGIGVENTEDTTKKPNDISCESFYFDSYAVYDFKTYEGFTYLLLNSGAENSIIHTEKSLYGEMYESFIDTIMSYDEVRLPKINGDLLPLRNEEGFSDISLFTSELYEMPWVWIHGKDVRVQATCPSVKVDTDNFEGLDASQILSLISPGAVNVHNYQEHENYRNVYCRDIIVSGKTVSALTYEFKNSEKIMVAFYYNDFYIILNAYPDVLNDSFFASFDFS